jgi:hypothetical protein
MKTLAATVVTLAWGFWLGGLGTLFASLGTIFTTPDYSRSQQGDFAQRLFPVFERMQLIFAAIALLGTAAWWMANRQRLKLVLFALFALATCVAVAETTLVTPRVQRLSAEGLRETPQFQQAHQLSSRVYMSGAVVVLLAGLLLPRAIRADAQANAATTPLAVSQTGEPAEPSAKPQAAV